MQRDMFGNYDFVQVEDKKHFLKIPAILLFSVFLCQTTLFNQQSPFPVAFLASLSGIDCLFAFAGSVIGYGISGHLLESIPNLAVMIAIGALRLLVGKQKNKAVEIASATVSGAAVFITGVVSALKPTDLLISVAFGFIAGISTYALSRLYPVISDRKSIAYLTPLNTAAAGILFLFFVAALSGFRFGVVHPAVLFSVVGILFCSENYGVFGSTLSACAAAGGLILGNTADIPGALMLCVAGCCSAFFARYHRITLASTFIFFTAITGVLCGLEVNSLRVLSNVIIAGVFYMAIPMKRIAEKFQSKPDIQAGAKISEIFSKRLQTAGQAIGEIGTAIEKTAEALDKKSIRDITWVHTSATDTVCTHCRFNMKCWGEEYNDNTKAFHILTDKLRKGETLQQEDLPFPLSTRCPKKDPLIRTVTARYREYVSIIASKNKLEQTRNLILSQLNATQRMMEKLAEEFESTQSADRKSAAAVERLMGENGLSEVKAAVLYKDGKMLVEGYGKGSLTCTAENFCIELSTALQREFDLPDISYVSGRTRILAHQSALFAIEAVGCQLNKNGQRVNGDYYDSFCDGRGNAYVVLSDGMGSGSRARVDSAFACGILVSMLKAGLDMDSVLEYINISLSIKSVDESFATLDICKINLYTGEAEILKAGGATSYLKCGKSLLKVPANGLPVGISNNPKLERKRVQLNAGDVLLMMSDGAQVNETWLEHSVRSWGDLNELSRSVALAAQSNARSGRGDDISVVAVRLVK